MKIMHLKQIHQLIFIYVMTLLGVLSISLTAQAINSLNCVTTSSSFIKARSVDNRIASSKMYLSFLSENSNVTISSRLFSKFLWIDDHSQEICAVQIKYNEKKYKKNDARKITKYFDLDLSQQSYIVRPYNTFSYGKQGMNEFARITFTVNEKNLYLTDQSQIVGIDCNFPQLQSYDQIIDRMNQLFKGFLICE